MSLNKNRGKDTYFLQSTQEKCQNMQKMYQKVKQKCRYGAVIANFPSLGNNFFVVMQQNFVSLKGCNFSP